MINFPNTTNFNNYEAQNMRLHNLGTNPEPSGNGRAYMNTTDGFIYYKDHVSIWRQLIHATALVQMRLDQFAAPNTTLSLNSQRIINLADPTNLQDAATKAYVDALIAGMRWKDACRVATTTTITRSGLQTIDGVSVVAGDRVGILDGTANAGIWVASAGAWARANDSDTAAEVFSMSFFVQEGTANGNAQYTCSTDNPITLNSTPLVFAKVGAGITYTAGPGIVIAGSTISIDTAVVVRKVEATLGNGSLTNFTLTHNLNSRALTVSMTKESTGEYWIPDWRFTGGTSQTQIDLSFGVAPSSAEFRVSIHG